MTLNNGCGVICPIKQGTLEAGFEWRNISNDRNALMGYTT